MAARIVELFGYSPDDNSAAALAARQSKVCPFVGGECSKTLNDGVVSGVCSLHARNAGTVIICPIRLYANGYRILQDVADTCFGPGRRLLRNSDLASAPRDNQNVVVFGRGWGHELRLPSRAAGGGSYFVDWVLALLNERRELQEFVAVEVQSIDTTGNYRAEREEYMLGNQPARGSTAGFNWENVNKRILPQLIYKGHVLRQEPLCTKGLFFICPRAVFSKISDRLGGAPPAIHYQSGAMTFRWYDLAEQVVNGQSRALVHAGQLTTTVDRVAYAFVSPTNLPQPRAYESAIRHELRDA